MHRRLSEETPRLCNLLSWLWIFGQPLSNWPAFVPYTNHFHLFYIGHPDFNKILWVRARKSWSQSQISSSSRFTIDGRKRISTGLVLRPRTLPGRANLFLSVLLLTLVSYSIWYALFHSFGYLLKRPQFSGWSQVNYGALNTQVIVCGLRLVLSHPQHRGGACCARCLPID